MKLIYIGTTIPEDAHRDLRILAAKEGGSVSGLLKRLTLDFVASPATPTKPARRKSKGVAK